MSIYQENILEHYRHPRNYGRLAAATDRVTVANPLCGDVICLEALIKKRILWEVRFSGEGCAISTAAASMLTEKAHRRRLKPLLGLTKNDMLKMLGIELSPNRLKCALLPWEALLKLIGNGKY
ncbi:iron-sulfur cluster assembly scaffold protein [Candidatus Roizmanbacteria bacterium]|nr:iron-sulfur cluster assembly scaffold protein [Candidatus Roizmanbacteria bacterium]